MQFESNNKTAVHNHEGAFFHCILALKAPNTTATDDILKKKKSFSEKTRLDIPCDSSAGQRIHMEYPALFSLKHKNKITKVLSASSFLGALRVSFLMDFVLV